MKPDYIEIGKRLKEARAFCGFKQQDVADAVNLSVSYVKNTERGIKPSIEYLFMVSYLCRVSIEWLLTGIGSGPGEQQQHPAPPDRRESSPQTQKIEAIFDPDLKQMVDTLKGFMESGDPDLRGWAKIQFKKAFGEQTATVEKKQHA